MIRARIADTPDGVVDALLGLDQVFPAELTGDETVRALVTEWHTALSKYGVEATLAGLR